MATRSGIRKRPVDEIKPLNLVLNEVDLDAEDTAREATAQDEHDKPAKVEPKDYGAIPIPPVTEVRTYAVDYLPVHKVPVTYLKAPKDRADLWEAEWQEYDLDVDDVEFLRDVNQDGTQERLTWRQLEEMLWHLEVKNAEANARATAGSGGGQAASSAAAFGASVDHLPKTQALDILYECAACQPYLRNRVYEFWKRKRGVKPALRRLQAPTPEADTNPYRVFRQRAKPNKPLTRRRRETQDESMDKISAILENLEHAIKLAGMVREREGHKMCLVNNFVDTQQYQLLSVAHARPQEQLDKALTQAMKGSFKTRAFEPAALPKPGEAVPVTAAIKRGLPGPPITAHDARKSAKRKAPKRGGLDARKAALRNMPPPPEPPLLCMSLMQRLCGGLQADNELRSAMEASVVERLDEKRLRVRIGRLGRIVLDQADADSLAPLVEEEGPDGEEAEKSEKGGDKGADAPQLSERLQRLQRLMEM